MGRVLVPGASAVPGPAYAGSPAAKPPVAHSPSLAPLAYGRTAGSAPALPLGAPGARWLDWAGIQSAAAAASLSFQMPSPLALPPLSLPSPVNVAALQQRGPVAPQMPAAGRISGRQRRRNGPPAALSSRSSGSVHCGALATIVEVHTPQGSLASLSGADGPVGPGHDSIDASDEPQAPLVDVAPPPEAVPAPRIESFSGVRWNAPEAPVETRTDFSAPWEQPTAVSPLNTPALPRDLQHRGNYLRKSHTWSAPPTLRTSPVSTLEPGRFDTPSPTLAQSPGPVMSTPSSPIAAGLPPLSQTLDQLVSPSSEMSIYLRAPAPRAPPAPVPVPTPPPETPVRRRSVSASPALQAPRLPAISSPNSAASSRAGSVSSMSLFRPSNGDYSEYRLSDYRLVKQRDASRRLPSSLPSLSQSELDEKREKMLRMQRFSEQVRQSAAKGARSLP